LERWLRKVIRNSLVMQNGKKKALEKVMSAIANERRSSLASYSIDTILKVDNSPLYFLDLISILKKNWEIFQNIFSEDKDKIIMRLTEINAIGRPEAHAKHVSTDDFQQLRLHFNKIEENLDEWL